MVETCDLGVKLWDGTPYPINDTNHATWIDRPRGKRKEKEGNEEIGRKREGGR
jgi:hypothetical protein